MPTLPHLHAHHGDFTTFRDLMAETAVARFGPIWWGVWEQLVAVRDPCTVVDLGTGPGVMLRGLRARLPRSRLIGVDVQPVMLEAARAGGAEVGAEIVEADLAMRTTLPDGVADVVTAVHLFHEMEFPPALLDEARRLLRPGGVLVLYDWVKKPLAEYLEAHELDEAHFQRFREHCLFTLQDLEWLVARAGFTLRESVGRRGGRYVIVVAEKA